MSSCMKTQMLSEQPLRLKRPVYAPVYAPLRWNRKRGSYSGDYSDYKNAPWRSCDFRGDFFATMVATFLRLCPSDFAPATLPLRLWRRQTHPRRPWWSDQGRSPKKIGLPTLNTPGPPPATPGPGPPTTAQEAPRREHRRPDMQPPPPPERPTEGHGKRHTRKRRERKRHTQAQGGHRTKEK